MISGSELVRVTVQAAWRRWGANPAETRSALLVLLRGAAYCHASFLFTSQQRQRNYVLRFHAEAKGIQLLLLLLVAFL